MKRRAVVFDLDGTLIDSRGDIAAACNAMLRKAGRAPLSEEVVSGFVGDGARFLVAGALGASQDDPEVDDHLEAFLDYYEAHPLDHTVILPGVETSLDWLASFPVALCTNKPRRTTLPVLDALGWTTRFGAIVAGGDTVQKKPHPEPLEKIARLLSVSPKELVMVGDGPQDIEAGRAAGALTIGVRGGILPIERLLAAKPDLLLNTLEELPAALSAHGFSP